jgi:hypothetical protein
MATRDAIEIRVRRQRKQLAVAIGQIEMALTQKGGTFDGRAKLRTLTEPVRVVLRARHVLPESWALAVLLNNERIDGIDWERTVRDHRGKQFDCSGWHRHIWKLHGGAGAYKQCLPDFNPSELRCFIRTGFKLLNVQLGRGGDDARGELFDY